MGKQTWVGTIGTAQTDGATLSAAARASCLPAAARFPIYPENLDSPGRTLRIQAHGRISSVITTPGTARFDVDFLDSAGNHVVVADSLAILLDTTAGHTNVPWDLDMRLTLRTIGAAANFMQVGKWFCESVKGTAAMPVTDGLAVLPWNTAPVVGANFNATLINTVDLFFTQTVASGFMTLHGYSIELMN